jgi:hypothetical protein
VKDIRDKARAIEMYARQAQNTEAERLAILIRLRAERKCGQPRPRMTHIVALAAILVGVVLGPAKAQNKIVGGCY